MVDLSEPASAVMSGGAAAVLRVFAGADGPFSVRELARLADVSPTRARQVVSRLADHGMLDVEESAGSFLVRLNREHLATEPAIALASLRARLFDHIREVVARWSPPALHVSLFGSSARGDGDTRSDIDLLVVHDDLATSAEQEAWDDQLARTADTIHSWTGNWVSWFQASETDLARVVTKGEPIVMEWQRDAVTLFGPPLPTLLRGVP